MATPAETLEKLSEINSESEDRWTVLIYWVNRDLIPVGQDNPVMAGVIPCGEYSRRDAEKERDRILAETGAHAVVFCANNHMFGLRPNPSKDTLLYNHDSTKSVEVITESIRKAKREKAQIQARLDKEKDERVDPESMSYLINKVYRTTSSKTQAAKFQELSVKATKAHKDNLDLVINHLKSHPERLDTWKVEAKALFEERGEKQLYDQMVIGMSQLEPQIRASFNPSTSKPRQLVDSSTSLTEQAELETPPN